MLFNIKDFTKYSPIYCETGSCYGQSIYRALQAGFETIYSVEADRSFYESCLRRFPGAANIHLYLGKSYEMLPEMLKDISQPTVIFLDAHPAGSLTFGHEEVMSGNQEYGQDTILTKELQAILAHRNDHIIIIDDQHGLDDLNLKYMRTLLEANTDYKFEFLDEQLEGGDLTKEKILVCIP